MNKIKTTSEALPNGKATFHSNEGVDENFCIFCKDEIPSRYGRCPCCCGWADRYGDIKFEISETKKEFSIEFFCQCRANWVEHYQINPLSITYKQDSSKFKVSPSEQLND